MALRSIKKRELYTACPDVVLGAELGAGGNARVYRGTSKVHGDVAVKFLLNDNTKRYSRFRDEVLVVTTRLLGSPRVLPILEHHLPKPPKADEVPWYVMPAARRLTDSLSGQPWSVRLQALIKLAEGLSEIHAKDVAHRDIKPDNLFELEGTYRFGDFGIAAFPESAGVTSTNEPMGPWGYMAPEMLSSSKTADPYKADVYSFAKTIWAVLTEQRVPFGGHYAAHTPIGLSMFEASKGFVVEPLDALLEQSTRVRPSDRPTAKQFSEKLQDVLATQGDFVRANTLQWEAAEVDSLRDTGLIRAVWEGAPQISHIITTLSRRHGLNHCFFPSGGGMTVEGASTCEADTMLSLRISPSMIAVVKPTRLTLERFQAGPEFSYAVLETADVEALGVESRFKDEECEMLKQVNDYDYVRDDSHEDESRNLRVGVACQRYFKGGVFVIAPTTGIYNRIDTYEGTATKLGRDRLRERSEKLIKQLTKVESQDQPWNLSRQVRLLIDADVANFNLSLEHIDDDTLKQLIAIDDALVEARKRDHADQFSSYDATSLERLLHRAPEPEQVAARALLRSLSKEQRAEYIALVYVGRGDAPASELGARIADNLRYKLEDHYLLEKLGNGYMRKALARFGLDVPLGETCPQN